MTELRDKIAIEAMKSLLTGISENKIKFMTGGEVAAVAYGVANKMIAAKEGRDAGKALEEWRKKNGDV